MSDTGAILALMTLAFFLGCVCTYGWFKDYWHIPCLRRQHMASPPLMSNEVSHVFPYGSNFDIKQNHARSSARYCAKTLFTENKL